MTPRSLVGCILIGVLLLGCEAKHEMPSTDSPQLHADLELLGKSRIYFGHQSVGRDLLQGLKSLSESQKVSLPISNVDDGRQPAGSGVFDANVGVNRDPAGKANAFVSYLASQKDTPFDVAMLKFCYEDVSARGVTDPSAVLKIYDNAAKAIREKQPALKIVHVTVPLRADPPGWKTKIKRLIGRETEEDADNRLRNQYNAALRKQFAGEPIFDIAALESKSLNGDASSFGDPQGVVYTLSQDLTVDGGHLNDAGRRIAAAEFAKVVADAIRKK